ncbi:uncharacterized protein LOC119501664 isoform X2 [Sebastes umbrosus]|uniref:uncharacterized protein LOC119501664 isoform X2 n=1 Tax=Sebastes umbrosus TaxID=72105 RepID=UPI00189F0154|nr:uncharacterized protein LOC119501664 isoform X2 [Sebastes umbrosus]
MSLKTFLTGVVVMSFFIGKTRECRQINTSCSDIQTGEGFQFKHRCPDGSDLTVNDNKTKLAFAVIGTERKNYSGEVIRLDNNSVVTRKCRDLQIECIVRNTLILTGNLQGEESVIDICDDYKITEKLKNLDPSYPTTPQNLTNGVPVGVAVGVTVGVLLGVLVLCGIIGMLCYIFWFKKQHDGATVPEFLRYLRTCSCLRNERGEAPKTGDPEGRGVQEVGSGALDTTQHNGGIELSVISASDRRGENVIEQDDTLESVHSNDPKAVGETPPSFSLNHILRNKGIQPTANGDISAPDMNRASIHQAVNGSLRDDPGGVNDSKGKGNVRIREMPNGRTRGDRGPEDDENDEGQPLMSDQRAANQGFDMTGGAVALVDKRGFDPDPVSRCSTAPDTDVESTSNMKNCSI